MTSLRWRIAALYALLLVAVMIVIGVVITARFEAILLDQARGRIDRTMQDIARVSNPAPNPFMDTSESVPAEQRLANADNLERWASTTTYIQVDNAQGYPEAKSSNLGDMTLPANRALSPGKDTAYRRVALPRGPFLIEDRLFTVGARPFTVHVAEPLDQLIETFARTQRTIGLIILLAGVAVVGLSILLAAQATNPLNELTTAMREIGSEHLSRRLKWTQRNDEIGRLAQTFDDMLERLDEAFARERRFISDASHELKTPLTSINANAQMLRRWGDADARIRAESLDTIVSETATLASMVNGMLTLAKANSGDSIPKEPLTLAELAADAVHGAQQRAAEKGLALHMHDDANGVRIMGDASLIRQMISNLIDNAIKFTDHGSIDVYVTNGEREAAVEVADTGPGIDADELPFIFDRFYRADKSRNRAVPGTGLGLAIVRSIARVHSGTVSAERRAPAGTCIRVSFPQAGPSVIQLS